MLKPEIPSFDLDRWLEHIQSQHSRTIDLTLDRVRQVWQALGCPQPEFNVVVAGTNGKGSSISILESVFACTGKRTGAYTSPHLVRFNERIRINRSEATDDEICHAFRTIEAARGGVPLTYFEYGTLCALLVFSRKNVEVGLLEVGMGGRLDAVNMVESDIVLITSIGIDHEQWLGSDREKIGAEKAGVIRENGVVVCADPEIPGSILRTASERNATLLVADVDYGIRRSGNAFDWESRHAVIPASWRRLENMHVPYPGDHQFSNLGGSIAVVCATVDKVGTTREDLQRGLRQARIAARCQVIRETPCVVVDVAHNRDSAVQLSRFLEARPCRGRTVAVFGVLADKVLDRIVLPLERLTDHWYLATLGGDRGQTAKNLGARLDRVLDNPLWSVHGSPARAYARALLEAGNEDRIVIFGSFQTVGDIMADLRDRGIRADHPGQG